MEIHDNRTSVGCELMKEDAKGRGYPGTSDHQIDECAELSSGGKKNEKRQKDERGQCNWLTNSKQETCN